MFPFGIQGVFGLFLNVPLCILVYLNTFRVLEGGDAVGGWFDDDYMWNRCFMHCTRFRQTNELPTSLLRL